MSLIFRAPKILQFHRHLGIVSSIKPHLAFRPFSSISSTATKRLHIQESSTSHGICPLPYRTQRMVSNLASHNTLHGCEFSTKTMIEIVSMLNNVGIPSILWWNSLIDIYGVPTVDIEMSFLIDRALISRAADVLSDAGLVHCNSQECYYRPPAEGDRFTYANPVVHYHIPSKNTPDVTEISLMWPSVQLHIRDERIWTIPSEGDTPTFTDSDNIIFADDKRLPPTNWNPVGPPDLNKGKCRHSPGSPVRILTPERYAEALVLLKLRDRGSFASLLWDTQINYLVEYGFVDLRHINEPTRQYMEFPTQVSLRDRSEKARAALGDTVVEGLAYATWVKNKHSHPQC
ncbi:hypothetical protein FQN49_002334 [Arthroderma sp. PD_2]|nr:hypothetical protein FQN49_002334 [Arthroderma sp. PD_2]